MLFSSSTTVFELWVTFVSAYFSLFASSTT
jgi:hypothetical protein